jgi:hypothetical protein
VANLKAVSFAYIEQAVEIVLGCHQIVVGQQNVIIVGEKFWALAENVVQALPFWAYSIDPRHVIGFEQIRVIAKITDGEIPVAAPPPASQCGCKELSPARTTTKLRLDIYAALLRVMSKSQLRPNDTRQRAPASFRLQLRTPPRYALAALYLSQFGTP